MALSGKICLVTGASRGIGKGIAVQLGEAGATVYITGRSSSAEAAVVGGTLKETEEEITARGGRGVAVVCDHSKDDQVKEVFEKIKHDHGKLDILVNNAYSAVAHVFKETSAGRKFWENEMEPGDAWDIVNNVGLRNHYVCSTYAARMMLESRQGLIVNISSVGGITYLFNVAYGVGKCALDRMTADMAVELKKHNVSCVTLYPGPVLTEHINNAMKSSDTASKLKELFTDGETPEFTGKAVVAVATDPNVMAKSGRVSIVAELALEYGFKDINGSQPASLRQLNQLIARSGHTWVAALIPNFVKIPSFLLALRASRF